MADPTGMGDGTDTTAGTTATAGETGTGIRRRGRVIETTAAGSFVTDAGSGFRIAVSWMRAVGGVHAGLNREEKASTVPERLELHSHQAATHATQALPD